MKTWIIRHLRKPLHRALTWWVTGGKGNAVIDADWRLLDAVNRATGRYNSRNRWEE